jgi:hypothetical protein
LDDRELIVKPASIERWSVFLLLGIEEEVRKTEESVLVAEKNSG